MKKRIGSVLLALALCLSLLPATALAEGAETVSTLNFCSDPPTVETTYNIRGGGTAHGLRVAMVYRINLINLLWTMLL